MKHTFICCVLFFILFNISDLSAQTTPPCASAECKQFDFWVGDWQLNYKDTMNATNTITKDMDGCVIHEHFNDPANKYKGESWSVYNPKIDKWQQTWVDNTAGYITLTGEFKDGTMTLYTEPMTVNNVTTQYRMLYHNITPVSFDWDWDISTDAGKTWLSKWHISYKRK